MKIALFWALGFLLSVPSWAAQPAFEGMVELPNHQKLYAIHYPATRPEAPTVVLLNGLTYTTHAWDKMLQGLIGHDYGVLLYDPRGMGKTLEETGPATEVIPIETQAEDLNLLLDHFKLSQVDVAGLSYGGALALVFSVHHPEKVRNLILMAPYVKALKQQDDMIRQKIQMYRWTHPTDHRTDDELYDEFLRNIIYSTYPIYEPVVKEHPWRLEAIWRMVEGVRKLKATDLVGTLSKKVHLVLAGRDQYVPRADHDEFWSALGKEKQASRIVIQGSEHKMPEAVPAFSAGWLTEIIQGNPQIADGRDFQGTPSLGVAQSGSIRISLPKDKTGPSF